MRLDSSLHIASNEVADLAARTCKPGYVGVTLALDLIESTFPVPAYLTYAREGTRVHSNILCAELFGDVTAVKRTALDHVAAGDVACDLCEDDWSLAALDMDDAIAVFVLNDWATSRAGTGIDLPTPTWNTTRKTAGPTWAHGIRALSDLAGHTSPAAERVRRVVLHGLTALDTLPDAKAARARTQLTTWWASARTAKGATLPVPQLDDTPDLVMTHIDDVAAAARTGTDEDVLALHGMLTSAWVWANSPVLDFALSEAVLFPDDACAASPMMKIPAASVWQHARHTGQVPEPFVLVPEDVPAADVHAAARLVGDDTHRIGPYAQALAAART